MSASTSSSSSATTISNANNSSNAASGGLSHHQPQNTSEWQLHLVLQRANLLQYFDTFISQGGDDVQQLLEAGEEEFLEIMALVGMASKPLHVRRLQKALQEYSTNPMAFQLIAFQKCGLTPPPGMSVAAASLPQLFGVPFSSDPNSQGQQTPPASATAMVTQLLHHAVVTSAAGGTPGFMANGAPMGAGLSNSESPGAVSNHSNGSAANIWIHNLPDGIEHTLEGYALPSTSPALTETQVQRIAECAQLLAVSLPDYEPKLVQNKKKISRELLVVMDLPDSGLRLDEFRKYARIYGRFDAKRKADKPLTLHEVSVNEAAAQICLHRPALLTRRDELFPLARQVVRDAGYHYVKHPGSHRHMYNRIDGHLDDGDLLLTGGYSTNQHHFHNSNKRSSPPESIYSDFEGSPAPSTSTASEMSPGDTSSSGQGGHHQGGTASETLTAGHFYLGGISKEYPIQKKRCLKEIGDEMQRIGREQEKIKARVAEAEDLVDFHAIQRDLNLLSQRQMELSNEQKAILETLRTEACRTGCPLDGASVLMMMGGGGGGSVKHESDSPPSVAANDK